MTMTKAKLVNQLSYVLGLAKSDVADIVDAFLDGIKSNLEQGCHVKLASFGNFILRDKKQRPGRNPKTGEFVTITSRRVITFRPGQKLKERLASYPDPEHVANQQFKKKDL